MFLGHSQGFCQGWHNSAPPTDALTHALTHPTHRFSLRFSRFPLPPMHELGITQNIVAIVTEYAQGVPVTRVTLEIGQLSAILPDAIRFCFDVCAKGTLLEGSTLEIIEVAGRGKCRHCGHETNLDIPYGICEACDSIELDIIAGQELKIKEMETAACA